MIRGRRIAGAAIGLVMAFIQEAAWADDEQILRQAAPFHACREMVTSMVSAIGAHPGQIRVEADTGAIYRLKVVSVEANLVFSCNKVNEAIEVIRTTPGEAVMSGG